MEMGWRRRGMDVGVDARGMETGWRQDGDGMETGWRRDGDVGEDARGI